MKFENTVTSNWKGAFHGLRHPLESYKRSDSEFGITHCYGDETLDIEDKWIKRLDPDLHEQYHSSEWLENTEKDYISKCEDKGSRWKSLPVGPAQDSFTETPKELCCPLAAALGVS